LCRVGESSFGQATNDRTKGRGKAKPRDGLVGVGPGGG